MPLPTGSHKPLDARDQQRPNMSETRPYDGTIEETPASPDQAPVLPLEPSVEQASLVALLRTNRLVTEQRLSTVLQMLRAAGKNSEQTLVDELQQQGHITSWQLKFIRAGKADQIVLDDGRYVILDELGHGGMGTVYRALHTRMNREVALKVIDQRKVPDRQAAKRFRRELEVSSKLQHEHIVQAFDVGEYKGVAFLVLEYVHGSDLAAIVKRDGPMAPDEAAAICLQAAAGLAYANAQGVIHRDIKPQNILLSTAGVTKILDMGLARVLEQPGSDVHSSVTQEGAMMGTLDYMPLEQARDAHSADARSDIYSLGATLYYLLTGHPPFPGGTPVEKLQRLANQEPEPLGRIRPDCPIHLVEVVEQMMRKRPEDRYQTSEDVVRALEPLAARQISGRMVVTASVQSAAATHRDTVATPEELFAIREQSITEMLNMDRRQRTLPVVWWLVAAGVLLAVGMGYVGWKTSNDRDRAKLAEVERQAAGNSASSSTTKAAPQPPAEIRVEWSQHYGGIWSAAWSPNGRELATGGGDGHVQFWNMDGPTIKPVASAPAVRHRGAVIALRWSPDGKWLASADASGVLHVWSRQTGEEIAKLPHWLGPFLGSLQFSPTGTELCYSFEGGLARWSLTSKQPIGKIPFNPLQVTYSRSGRFLALALVREGGGLIVWDTDKNEEVFRHEATDRLFAVGFTSDDLLAAAVGFKADTSASDADPGKRRIEIWDVRTGEHQRDIGLPEKLVFRDGGIPAVYFAQDGSKCIAFELVRQPEGAGPAFGPVWRDLKTGAELGRGPEGRTSTGSLATGVSREGGRIATVTSSPGGDAVALSLRGNRVVLETLTSTIGSGFVPNLINERYLRVPGLTPPCFDLASGATISDFPTEPAFVSSDGRLSYVTENRIITRPLVRKDDDPRPVPIKLEGGEEFTGGRWWSRSGRDLIGLAAGNPGPANQLRIWDGETGRIVRTVEYGPRVRVITAGIVHTPDMSVLAIGYQGMPEQGPQTPSGMIRLWRSDMTSPAVEFPAPPMHGGCKFAISDDGKLMATTNDLGYGVDPIHLFDPETGKLLSTFKTGLEYPAPVYLEFSPTGRYLLVTRHIWDVSDLAVPHEVWTCPEDDHAFGVGLGFRWGAFLPDDRHVLIGQDAQLQVWDFLSKEKDKTKAKKLSIHLLPDNQWVMINHTTRHWTSSLLAGQFLRLPFSDPKTGTTEWLSPVKYQDRTGFIPDPKKVGLGFIPQ